MGVMKFSKTLVIVLTPILLLPLPLLTPSNASMCAYVILIIAVYWMTEALPMASTALFPIMLFPFLGVCSSKALCKQYMKDSNFLFFSGLVVAVAIEKWNLHRRIALRVLITVGGSPKWLMLGFISVTGFLSMWISNTATTAMIIPIVHAVLLKLEDIMNSRLGLVVDEEGVIIARTKGKAVSMTGELIEKESEPGVPASAFFAPPSTANLPEIPDEEDILKLLTDEEREEVSKFRSMNKALRLCVCISANVGGTATITGTGPNIIIQGQMDDRYEDHPLSFGSWVFACLPNAVILLFIVWVYLVVYFMGYKELMKATPKSEGTEAAAFLIRSEYANLGKITFAEIAVACHFLLLGFMWMTRDPRVVPGWSSLYGDKSKFVTDASCGVTVCCMLFVFPSRWPNFLCFRKKGDESVAAPAPALLDWKTVQRKLAWDVIIILGGGFAIAEACQISGLSEEIGTFLKTFGDLPKPVICALISIVTLAVTQLTSNISTTTIFLPIVASLAESIEVNPMYFMIPVTLSASFAFMLPVSTPPNAIVLAFGRLELKDMMFSGIGLSLICMAVTQIIMNTWAAWVFDLNEFPKWASENV